MLKTASNAWTTFSSPLWFERNKGHFAFKYPTPQQYSLAEHLISSTSAMWQYNPDNPNIPRWKPEPRPILDSLVLQNSGSMAVSPTERPNYGLNDVERALTNIKATLRDLDRALYGVQQRLVGIAKSLNISQPMPNRERIPPRLQARYISAAPNATEYNPAEEDWEEEEQRYVHEPDIDPTSPVVSDSESTSHVSFEME